MGCVTRAQAEMHAQAQALLPLLQAALGARWSVRSAPVFSQIGSGAMPIDQLPSWGLALAPADGKRPGRALAQLEGALRSLPRPVIGRIASDALWLDLRCLAAADMAPFTAQLGALSAALQGAQPPATATPPSGTA